MPEEIDTPEVPKPWLLRPMTKEEEASGLEDPVYTHGGYILPPSKEVVYMSGHPPEDLALILRHEIGHIKFYPFELHGSDDYGDITWEEFEEKYPIEAAEEVLFCEALAHYHSLSIDPEDPVTRDYFNYHKELARDGGVSESRIQSIGRKAKRIVALDRKRKIGQ